MIENNGWTVSFFFIFLFIHSVIYSHHVSNRKLSSIYYFVKPCTKRNDSLVGVMGQIHKYIPEIWLDHYYDRYICKCYENAEDRLPSSAWETMEVFIEVVLFELGFGG